jgi:hypothetical protein
LFVPAGNHRLVFRYQPASVVWGAGLSVLGISALIGLFLVARRRELSAASAQAI